MFCFPLPWGLFFLFLLSIPCLLSSVCSQDPGRAPCSGEKNELLTLLKAWRAPAEEASVSLVQSAEDLKGTLCTAAAFLQGLCEGGGHPCHSLPCSFVPAHPPFTHLLLLFWLLFLSMPAIGLFSSEKSLDSVFRPKLGIRCFSDFSSS